jgi:hypothetical protein
MAVKEVVFDLIDAAEKYEGGNPHAILAEIRKKHHADTIDAKVALAWKRGVKANPDGHVILGMCVRAGDLQRELVDYDFCIWLNREVWMSEEFTRKEKLALIDHEMCHVAHAMDDEGGYRQDTKGRFVWRLREHDIEEFTCVIERHGCYKRDLENFAQKILEQKNLLVLTRESQPEQKIIRGETILIPPKASMGTEMIDPFPDGKVN